MSDKPTVIEALGAVMGDVQSVAKKERNAMQNFNFRGIDAVVNAVGPAFRKHGVIAIPVAVDYEAEHYTTAKGSKMKGVTARIRFRFYGPAGDYIEAEVLGESSDAGDKAVPKAHSVAYRTLLLQALCIPTDEPDPDLETHTRSDGEPKARASRVDASRRQGPGGPKPPSPSEKPMFDAPGAKPASEARKKKLDVLVGTLRDAGHITTEQVYRACQRDPKPNAEGRVSWGELRESLTNDEASSLIDRLVKFEANVKKAAA